MAAQSGETTQETSESGEEPKQLPQWMTLDQDSDTKTLVTMEKSGKIPSWLSGNLYRNGPGVFSVGQQRLEHLFDGFAVVHRFRFQDGDVSYQSRILDSDTWVRSCDANQLLSSQFVTGANPDPSKSLFDRVVSYLLPINPDDVTDNTSMNIVQHGDKLYALMGNPILNEVDPETLLKKSTVDLRQTMAVQMATPHPHFGPDGTMYNLGVSFNPTAAYSIMSIPPEQTGSKCDSADTEEEEGVFKKASLLTTIPSRFRMHVSYGHSFGMSQEHFVVLEQSIAMNIAKVLTMNWRRDGIASTLNKFPEEKMAFYVIRRSDNQLLPVTFQADPGFCFHFVNCHEVEEHLVVDLCCYEDVNIIDSLCLSNMADAQCAASNIPQATLRRYVLPINVTEADPDVNLVSVPETKATAHMVTPGTILCSPDYITDDKIPMEQPGINYQQCNGKKYRYVYGTSTQSAQQSLVKVDMEQRKAVYWKETGYSPGEPVFVARPGATAEDDGVVVSAVLSELPHTPSFLLVLDAKTFKELGRAIAPCDVKMANSFHGSFIPDKTEN